MPQLAVDTEVGAEKRRREFCNQFFGSVGLRAEAILEITIESGLVSAPMPKLMKCGCKISLTGAERRVGWHLDDVERGDETRATTTMANVGIRCLDEPQDVIVRGLHIILECRNA